MSDTLTRKRYCIPVAAVAHCDLAPAAGCRSRAATAAAPARNALPAAAARSKAARGKASCPGAGGRSGQRGGRSVLDGATRQCCKRPRGCPRPVAACHPLYFSPPNPPRGLCARCAPGGTRRPRRCNRCAFSARLRQRGFSPPRWRLKDLEQEIDHSLLAPPIRPPGGSKRCAVSSARRTDRFFPARQGECSRGLEPVKDMPRYARWLRHP